MRTTINYFIIIAAGMLLLSCAYSKMDGGFEGFWGEYVEGFYDEDGDKYEDFTDNPFIETSQNPVSTFSVDADGASYANMRRFIREGMLPNKSAVRIEEFLNYFTFDYAEPGDGNSVAINAEATSCPWNDEHRLLRLGIKGKSLSVNEMPVANFVFLIDVSGSMDSDDKLPLLKQGLSTLVDYLNPNDRVSIVTYAGKVQKLLKSTPASNARTIKNAIGKLSARGVTNGGEALKMAYEEALANYIKGGNNRVILGTDGDFNVGVTSTDKLIEMVESYADKGLYLTVCGFGRGNLNDSMMEKISNSGNGTYEYIDSEGEMTKVFVSERSKFVSVANDAKCQVTFNVETVSKYRLIGYENRVLNEEDFENDDKDAGEIGAGQTITALYEIVPSENYLKGESKVGTFDCRYKKALGSTSIPLTLEVSDTDGALSENMSFAAGIAAYGMILRESPYLGNSTFNMAAQLVKAGTSQSNDKYGYRAELLDLINTAKTLKNN